MIFFYRQYKSAKEFPASNPFIWGYLSDLLSIKFLSAKRKACNAKACYYQHKHQSVFYLITSQLANIEKLCQFRLSRSFVDANVANNELQKNTSITGMQLMISPTIRHIGQE